MASLSLSARIESWPIEGAFTISRGSKREAVVVVAEVTDGRHTGLDGHDHDPSDDSKAALPEGNEAEDGDDVEVEGVVSTKETANV